MKNNPISSPKGKDPILMTMVIIGLVAWISSYAMEHLLGWQPCSLCLLTRWVLGVTVIYLMLCGAWQCTHRRLQWQGVIWWPAILLTAFGVLINTRHLWVMSQPAETVGTCAPGLEYLMNNVSFFEAVWTVLLESGDCAKSNNVMFGLPLPVWTFGLFVLLLGLAILGYWRAKRKR